MQKWTWTGARFTKQKPKQKQLAALNLALLLIRARFYDPNLGEFISRDPLGFVDGLSLYRAYFVPGAMDPLGLFQEGPGGVVQPDEFDEVIKKYEEIIKNGGTHHGFDPNILWRHIALQKSYSKYKNWRFRTSSAWDYFQRGCLGVAGCMGGWDSESMADGGDCYSTLKGAQAKQSSMEEDGSCRTSCVPMAGAMPLNSRPGIIAKTWRGWNNPVFDENGFMTGYSESNPYEYRYDFGYYDSDLDAFFHAYDSIAEGHDVLVSKPSHFHNYHGTKGWKTIYCVVCEGASPGVKYPK